MLNLSAYYSKNPNDRDFLQRYLKLTHCDLFFADAAILVEGNVERLLLPVMIERVAGPLQSACLSILEVGGAFAHRFKSLIEFLGLTALIITDIDSVAPVVGDEEAEDGDEATEYEVPNVDAEKPTVKKRCKSCLPSEPGAVTSNPTLIQWIPKKQTIAELFAATPSEKLHADAGDNGFKIRVTYQTPCEVTWNNSTENVCGRTLEVNFGLENAAWVQHADRKHIGLKVRSNPATPSELAAAIHKRVGAKSFDKTTFALGVLTEPPANWQVPQYIREGLEWLRDTVKLELPTELPPDNAPEEEVAEAAQ